MRRFRFGFLLGALLLMLVYAPLVELLAPGLRPTTSRLVLAAIFGGLTISAVYAVSESRKAPIVAVLLGIPALVTQLVDIGLLSRETHLWGHVFGIIFLCHIIYVMLEFIFRQQRIEANTVFASLCVYLLMGVLWAFIYSLLEFAQPGSFSHASAAGQPMRVGSEATSMAIYFSFVTMTTLGYGDIVPQTSSARAFTTLQAVTGQLYLTVLVAWLVGLHVAHSKVDD